MAPPTAEAPLEVAAFRHFPHGILVLDEHGRLCTWNDMAGDLLGELSTELGCCELLGCGGDEGPPGGACFTALALDRDGPVPEVRVGLKGSSPWQAAWATAARLGPGSSHVAV